jgi:hypothetical protein
MTRRFIANTVNGMDARTELGERTQLTGILGALLALGLVRAAARIYGLVALLIVVIACVGAFAIGIVVLRVALLH